MIFKNLKDRINVYRKEGKIIYPIDSKDVLAMIEVIEAARLVDWKVVDLPATQMKNVANLLISLERIEKL